MYVCVHLTNCSSGHLMYILNSPFWDYFKHYYHIFWCLLLVVIFCCYLMNIILWKNDFIYLIWKKNVIFLFLFLFIIISSIGIKAKVSFSLINPCLSIYIFCPVAYIKIIIDNLTPPFFVDLKKKKELYLFFGFSCLTLSLSHFKLRISFCWY